MTGDFDGDGYAAGEDCDDGSATTTACSAPTGHTADALDCDDYNAAIYLGAAEVGDRVDNDCDGLDTDCDDTRATVHPGASETCNSIDDDCDGTVDEPPGLEVCSSGATYTNIQDAVSAAKDGDTIFVCAGTYRESVSISGKAVEIIGDGADDTVLDGGHAVGLTTSSATVSLSGLTLTGTSASSSDGDAIDATGSTLVLDDVYFMDVSASSYPIVYLDNSTLDLDDFVVMDNTASRFVTFANTCSAVIRHGVVTLNAFASFLYTTSTPEVELSYTLVFDNTFTSYVIYLSAPSASAFQWAYDNVVYDNTTTASSMYAFSANSAWVLAENNIVADNTGFTGFDVHYGAVVEYNDAHGQTTSSRHDYLVYEPSGSSSWTSTYDPGETNLVSRPRFMDPDAYDFRLDPDYSHCIDAGTPLSGYEDPDGTPNDMGIFGGPFGDWTLPL